MAGDTHEAQTVDKVLARKVEQYRRRRGWTAQRLSDEIAKLGGHIGRATISRIENGDRAVAVDEYVLLAAALNVPPPLLLLPIGEDVKVKITTRSVIHPHLAYKWLSGGESLATTDRRAIRPDQWADARRPLVWYQMHDQAKGTYDDAYFALKRAEVLEDAKAGEEVRRAIVDALEHLAEVRSDMTSDGVAPPALGQEQREQLEKLGYDPGPALDEIEGGASDG